MMKAVPKFELLFILFIAFIFLSCSSGEAENNPIEKNEEGEILAPEDRTWNNDLIGEEISLHKDIVDSLHNLGMMKAFDKQLYLSDSEDMRIKRFDMDGRYIGHFGSEGRGPGEFQQVQDFDFAGDTLFVTDAMKIGLMSFDVNSTEFITSHKIDTRPYRMAVIDDHFIIESSIDEKLFHRFDFRGNKINQFGEVMENQRQNFMSVMGEIHAAGDTGFVYAPQSASYLFYYNSEGDRTRTIRTPDRIPFQEPVQETRGDQQMIRNPESEVMTFDLQISDGRVYEMLKSIGNEKEVSDTFLDVYDLESGQYMHSIELPNFTRNVVFIGDMLYLYRINIGMTKVQAYEFNQ